MMSEVSRNTLDIMRLDREIKKLKKMYTMLEALIPNEELDKIISEDTEDDNKGD